MRRALIIGVAMGLALLYAASEAFGGAYGGSTALHHDMELFACIVAFFAGTLAIVRHLTQHSGAYLFIGLGFFATSSLDLYHTIVTSSQIQPLLLNVPETLIPWSWMASRMMLSILMAAGAFARPALLRRRWAIYVSLPAVTLLLFVFFIAWPLPPAYYADLPLGRPQELVAGLLFAAALWGYLRRGRWKHDPFEMGIVVSLIVDVAVQCLVMPRSYVLFDANFDLAHLLKIVSYGAVIVGLLVSSWAIYQQEEASKLEAEAAHMEADAARRRIEYIYNTNVAALFTTKPDGEFVHLNESLASMVGLSRDEVMGRRAHEFYAHAEDRQELVKILRQQGKVENFQLELRHVSGSLFWGNFSAMYNEAEGYLEGAIIDITEQVETAKALAETAAINQAVWENAVDGLVRISLEGYIEAFNPAAEHLFDYAEAEVVGRNVKLLTPDHIKPQHDGYLKRYAETGVAHIIGTGQELEARRKDGSMVPIELSVSEILVEGQCVGYAGRITDITERKALEQQVAMLIRDKLLRDDG